MLKYITIVLIILAIIITIYKAIKNKEASIQYFNPDSINQKKNISTVFKSYSVFIKPFESKVKLSTTKLLNNKDIINEYYNKIIPFTVIDKNIISTIIGDILIICFQFKHFYNNFEWNIIKVKDSLEWGMPFTLKNYIFLPESSIAIVKKKQLKNTLIHEQIHIYQRKNPIMFAKLYLDLGYIYIDYLRLPSYIEELRITNPDGLHINWVYVKDNTYFLPILMMDENDHNNIMQKGMFLQKNGKYYEPIMINEKTQLIDIKNYDEFYNRFKGTHGLYHPNELLAHSFTDWFLDKNPINKEIQTFFETKMIQQVVSETDDTKVDV